MRVYSEISLRDFEFWSGSKYTVSYLTPEELDTIEATLEYCHPEGLDETAINDLFWLDEDTIASWLGYKDFEEIMNRDEEDEEDEEEEE